MAEQLHIARDRGYNLHCRPCTNCWTWNFWCWNSGRHL